MRTAAARDMTVKTAGNTALPAIVKSPTFACVRNMSRNDETMQRLNKELREAYAKIMANEHMARYDAAKTEFDAMFQRVKGILDLCAEGGDPETCDYDAASCSGDCASCGGGCH